MRPFLLVDGNNLLVRAVEATRHAAMHSNDGTDTSALVVFIKTISRYIREEKPYRVMVCWDSGTAYQSPTNCSTMTGWPKYSDSTRPICTAEAGRWRMLAAK